MTSSRRTQKEIIESLQKKPGLRSRIDAHCVWCSYDELVPGSWRKQVRECGVSDCPLFDVRPSSAAKQSVLDPQVDQSELNHSDDPLASEKAPKGVVSTIHGIDESPGQACEYIIVR